MPIRSTKAKRRSSGRPIADRVGEERILHAALELLKTTHPAQVNRLDIARAAGVDPALIRYYFGTKDELLARAIVVITEERIDGARSLETSTGTARTRLEDAIRAFFLSITTHPHYHQLILQQIYQANTQRAKELRLRLQLAGQRGLKSIIDQGVASGEFREVDTRFLEIALLGMCDYIVTAWPLFEDMFDASPDNAAVIEQYLAFIVEMVLGHVSFTSQPATHPGGARRSIPPKRATTSALVPSRHRER